MALIKPEQLRSGSYNITGSLFGTASYAIQALTASYLNTLNQNLTFNGNLTLNGTASISYLNVSYESASVIYSSGSNQFGDAANDTQTLYGSVIMLSGSVGIGNTNPGGDGGVVPRLAVANPSNIDKFVGIGYDNTGDYGFIHAIHRATAWKNIAIQAFGGNVGIGTTSPQSILDVITPVDGYASFASLMSVGQFSGIHFGYRENNTSYRKSAIVFERTDLTFNNAQGKVHILNGPQAGAGSATLADSRLTIAENGNVGIGTTSPSAKLDVSGSARITDGLTATGSLRGQVSALSIASNTASLNMSTNNFFTLALVNGANTNINPTNINPGQTVNILVSQSSAGTGTVTFPSIVKQLTGSLYTGSAVANAVDIVTMITFDTSTVYVSSIRNLV